MSDIQVTTTSSNDRILTGQANWTRWYSDSKAGARADDTWALFDGTETILEKPQRAAYLWSTTTLSSTPSSDGSTTVHQMFSCGQSLDLYMADLHDYEHQHTRVCRANKMLHDRINPSMRPETGALQNPAFLALRHLETRYKMQDSLTLPLTRDKIDRTTSRHLQRHVGVPQQDAAVQERPGRPNSMRRTRTMFT